MQYRWDALQRYYAAHYVVASAGWFNRYLVLHTVDRRGQWHPTIPAEVAPVKLASYTRGAIPFRLSEAAVERGAVRLANPVIAVDKARFAAFLRDWVYDGRTLTDLAKPGVWWGLGVMLAGLCFAWPQDRRDAGDSREREAGAGRGTGDARRVQPETEIPAGDGVSDAGAAEPAGAGVAQIQPWADGPDSGRRRTEALSADG